MASLPALYQQEHVARGAPGTAVIHLRRCLVTLALPEVMAHFRSKAAARRLMQQLEDAAQAIQQQSTAAQAAHTGAEAVAPAEQAEGGVAEELAAAFAAPPANGAGVGASQATTAAATAAQEPSLTLGLLLVLLEDGSDHGRMAARRGMALSTACNIMMPLRRLAQHLHPLVDYCSVEFASLLPHLHMLPQLLQVGEERWCMFLQCLADMHVLLPPIGEPPCVCC
jgi:hypothetical protein